MKTRYWKHPQELVFWIIMAVCSFVFVAVGFLVNNSQNQLWVISLIGGILLVVCLLTIFFEKRILSKVEFFEDGFTIKRFNRVINSYAWEDVQQVSATPRSRSSNWLTFIVDGKQEDFELTKKMYQTIMIICPDHKIKNEINNLRAFICFHKKD